MKNQQEFIIKFIDRYYQKSLRKRRSSKNQAKYIAHSMNNVFKKHFDRKVKFDEKEIYDAFKIKGFTIMESTTKDFTWEKFHSGDILITDNLYINIVPQCNHDLRSVMKRSFPDSWHIETRQRLENIKIDLGEFWKENKHLMDL